MLDVLGEGGFSITYVGLEGSRQMTVAIKELFPLGCQRQGSVVRPAHHWDEKSFAAALADFVAEGKLLKCFSHPAIVQSYAPFEENGTAYLAMEFLQGESLLLGLQRRGAMNQQQALKVARQLGEALRMVHECDVIHSDIKPENIIHTLDERFVLLDFGASRRQSPGRAAKTAVLAVSPGYSPPEQYYASKELTPATDVYALAATLYALLSFSVPVDSISRERGTELPSLVGLNPSVTPAFWSALERALDLKPERRPQSMNDFLYGLEGAELGGSQHILQPDRAAGPVLQVEKLAEFEAHRGGIYGLLLHPTQPLLISGARNGSVGLWSWPHGEPAGALKAHETAMTGFAISPDGALLATAGEPGEVKLWSVGNGQMLRVLRSGLPAVFRLAFSADGQSVAAAMADGTLHLFMPGRAEPFILTAHSGAASSVAFSPDGTLMASAGADGLVIVWRTETLAIFRQLAGHTRPVTHVEFSPDSKLILSGSNDCTTRVWDVDAGLELRRYRDGAITWSGAFSCDPDIVVTANADKKLRFYRLSTGREVSALDADKNYVRSVVCDPRHAALASGGGDGRIRIWKFQP